VVVIQSSGEWAPQRKDKFRRTMPYGTAQQAISDAASLGKTTTYHTESQILEGSVVALKARTHEVEDTLEITRNVVICAETEVTAQNCTLLIQRRSLLISSAKSLKIENVSLVQKLGDGAEDYWSGGLFVVKVEAGQTEVLDCFIQSQRGTGVVADDKGKVMLEHCNIFECGQYGVGADGPEALVDVRDCTIEACKFEAWDERNGARVVGVEDED